MRALVCAIVLFGGAVRAEPPTEIAARVLLETPGDGGKSDWVDFFVEGGGVPSIERCERLVDAELKRGTPPGLSTRPRLARPCRAAPLPSPGPPMLEAQVLRQQEPLPTLDLFAVTATPTTGRIVRYTRMLSAVECEKRRERLVVAARGEPAKEQAKKYLEEQQRLNAEQIRKACDSGGGDKTHQPVKRGRAQHDKWLEKDEGRSRCEQAKRMGEILAGKRAEHEEGRDPVERGCVRE